MLRIAVCDDMRPFLETAGALVSQWPNRPDDLVVELFEDGDALLTAHAAQPFHIILLDVVMPLFNGIETAEELRRTDRAAKLVFLTFSPEFAVDSYRVKASNYLLKPIDGARLFPCLDEVYAELAEESSYLTVRSPAAVHRVELRKVEIAEAFGKTVVLFLSNGGTLESIDPLYFLEDSLGPEHGFFRCHRSYIVNLRCVDTYSRNEVRMRCGRAVPISRGRQKEFENTYFELLFGKDGDR